MSKIDVLFLANFIILAPHIKHGTAKLISGAIIFAMAYLTWWA